MKKIIFGFLACLVIVYLGLSLICYDKEYQAEKIYYNAARSLRAVQANPEVVTTAMLEPAVRGLSRVISKYPDTNMSKIAYINLAELYLTDKKYDKVTETVDTFIKAYPDAGAMLARAYFLKGAALEKQGKWTEALSEYNLIKEKYVNTPIGLQIPVYIAQYYEKNKSPEKAQKAYEEAIVFYEKVETDNKGQILGYAATNILFEVYMKLARYEDAGRVVESTIKNYSSLVATTQYLPYVDEVFVKILKRPDKAIEIYQYIIANTNVDRLKEMLEKKVDQLRKM